MNRLSYYLCCFRKKSKPKQMLDIYYNGLHDNILDKNKEKDRNTASSFNRSLTSIDKNYSMSDDSDITITFNDIYKK